MRLREWKSRCTNTRGCPRLFASTRSNTPSREARCLSSSVRPTCRATYQSGKKSSSRRSSASSYGGSTPSREARWKRISASIASRYIAFALACVETREISGGAEVLEQQEAAVEILRVDFRRVHARVAQQLRHVNERPAILHRRRRVHRNASAAVELDAEIAAKARVLGSPRKRKCVGIECAAQPVCERRSGGGRRRACPWCGRRGHALH